MKLEMICKNNYHLTEKLKKIIENKVEKLNKYFPDDETVAKVVLTDLGRQCKMELSINYYGSQLRAEVVGNTMYYNIDECMPKIERQLVKYREKLSEKKRLPAFDDQYQFVSEVEIEPLKIEKTKQFVLERITPIEAAENLEMIGHDFYLFINSQTGNTEAVYRRKDGSIGLLQPINN